MPVKTFNFHFFTVCDSKWSSTCTPHKQDTQITSENNDNYCFLLFTMVVKIRVHNGITTYFILYMVLLLIENHLSMAKSISIENETIPK